LSVQNLIGPRNSRFIGTIRGPARFSPIKFPRAGEFYAVEATAYSPRLHDSSARIDFRLAKRFCGNVRLVLSPITAPGPRLIEQAHSTENLMLKQLLPLAFDALFYFAISTCGPE